MWGSTFRFESTSLLVGHQVDLHTFSFPTPNQVLSCHSTLFVFLLSFLQSTHALEPSGWVPNKGDPFELRWPLAVSAPRTTPPLSSFFLLPFPTTGCGLVIEAWNNKDTQTTMSSPNLRLQRDKRTSCFHQLLQTLLGDSVYLSQALPSWGVDAEWEGRVSDDMQEHDLFTKCWNGVKSVRGMKNVRTLLQTRASIPCALTSHQNCCSHSKKGRGKHSMKVFCILRPFFPIWHLKLLCVRRWAA